MSDQNPNNPHDVQVETHGTNRFHATNHGLDVDTYGDVLSTARNKTGDAISDADQLGPDTVVTYGGVATTLKGLEAAGLARRDPQAPGGYSFGEAAQESQTGLRAVSQTTEQIMSKLTPHLEALGYDRATMLSTLVAGSPQARQDLVRKLGERGVPREGLEQFVDHMGREAEQMEDVIAQRAGGSVEDIIAWARSNGKVTQLKFARSRLLQGDPSGWQYLAKSAADAGRMSGQQVPQELLTTDKHGNELVDLRRYGFPLMHRKTFDRMQSTGELKQLAQRYLKRAG
jgi:hypothetical protein